MNRGNKKAWGVLFSAAAYGQPCRGCAYVCGAPIGRVKCGLCGRVSDPFAGEFREGRQARLQGGHPQGRRRRRQQAHRRAHRTMEGIIIIY